MLDVQLEWVLLLLLPMLDVQPVFWATHTMLLPMLDSLVSIREQQQVATDQLLVSWILYRLE